jgi:hypothetical protein
VADEQKGIFAPDNYRELSKPFDGPEAANKALAAFQDELYELRNKHRIANFYWVAKIPLKYEDGDEGEQFVVAHYGDELKREEMAAFAFGYESSHRQERIAKLLKHATKAVGKAVSRK